MRSSLRALRRSGRSGRWCAAVVLVAAVGMALVAPALAQRDRGGRGLGHYVQRNLVSDVPGAAASRSPTGG